MIWEFITRSAGKTFELGERLGLLLNAGDVVALSGLLGVGKTVLAKGIGKGLGVAQEVLSPSFNIVLEYKGRVPFRHVDFYRLGEAKEAFEMGMEEYIESDGVTVIEWAERLPSLIPSAHLFIEMDFGPKDERAIKFFPRGKRFEKIVKELLK